jgi:hypothetical protein
MKPGGGDAADLEDLYPTSIISEMPHFGHLVLNYLVHDMVTHINSIVLIIMSQIILEAMS